MPVFRKATAADTDQVLTFYHDAIDEMAGTDFDIMWQRDVHPTDASIREAVEDGGCFIGVDDDGRIVSGAVVNHEQADGYELVSWQIDTPVDEVGIVHSVYTSARAHGQGYATQLMEHLINASREDGLRSLRLDTLTYNKRGQGLYEKCGFSNRGTYSIFYEEYGPLDLVMYEYVL
ncbi:MAG: GNAT family N-acetyltransferase [Eggerthellaceae bacterium]|nr:GNAT family N-acetyltransferase [Eggerthellaceae bacterium]